MLYRTRWSNSPKPWHCVSFCNFGIFIFSRPPWSHLHLPLAPCLSRCFSVQLPQEEMLMLSCSSQWTQQTEQGGHIGQRDGTPLDFITTGLRGAEISQDCFLVRENSVLSSHVRPHSPTAAHRHWRCTEIALKELVIISQALWKFFCTAFTL